MSWEKIAFGSLYMVPTRNGIYKDKSSHGTGVKIVNMGEIFAYDFIGDQEMQRIEMTPEEMQVSGLQENDLLFARRSLVESGAGKASIVANLSEPTTFESSIIRVRLNPQLCHPLFYLYWLRCLAGRAAISALVTGLNVKGIRGSELKGMVVDYPPLEIQKRIAGVLKRYDNLIENNQKQIKLLEEAAQRLYKEWFVDLRFPGHETTPIVDGVPEGWKKYKFSEIVAIMSGGTPKTDVKEYYDGDIPFYTPKDSDASFFAFDTITHISQSGLDHCNSQYYPVGTVIITARGTVGKTTILAVPMAMNQSCYALKCDELDSPYYLFFSLNKEVAALKTMANGGVFNTIIVKTFDSIHLTVPTRGILTAFDAVVSPIMDQIKAKMQQNTILAETRDRLLPKLMNREIEV